MKLVDDVIEHIRMEIAEETGDTDEVSRILYTVTPPGSPTLDMCDRKVFGRLTPEAKSQLLGAFEKYENGEISCEDYLATRYVTLHAATQELLGVK